MSPIYSTYNENGDELFIDLRRITHIVRLKSEMDSSYVRMDPADHDMLLPDRIADPLREAWIAYNNGEHAPTPAAGVPGLPDGWEWDTNFPGITRAVARGNPRCIVTIMPNGIVAAVGACVEDVEAVIAAHRARAGGAA